MELGNESNHDPTRPESRQWISRWPVEKVARVTKKWAEKNIISCLGFPAYSNIPRITGACGNMAMTVLLGFINQKSLSRSGKSDRHVEATQGLLNKHPHES